jgi:outer membrane protein assembly factor BamB
MKRTLGWVSAAAACVLCVACGSNLLRPHQWASPYSDPLNSGFNAVRTADATATTKRWSTAVGPLVFSYPVVGRDGTIYIGNAAGQAVGLNPDGTVRFRYLMGSAIVAAPAVDLASGDVYFIVQNPLTPTEFGSFIYRLAANGTILSVSTEDFVTTGAPKLWRNYVFVVARDDLYVFDRVTLGLVAKAWASQCFNLVCAGYDLFGWFWTMVDMWKCMITGWPSDCLPSFAFGGPLNEASVAILDNPALGGDPDRPLVVVTTQRCASAWRFDPTTASGERLQYAWGSLLVHMDCDFKKVRAASPAVIAGGQMVFGDENGRVLSLDPTTGGQFWKSELGGSVQAPVVAFLRQIYVPMWERLLVLDSDGTTISETPLRGFPTMAALSLNRVYVTTSEGIHSFALDPRQGSTFEALTTGMRIGAAMQSGLAIAQDGTVYVSTPNGFVHAFGQAPR